MILKKIIFFFLICSVYSLKLQGQDEIILKEKGVPFDYNIKILKVTEDSIYYRAFRKTRKIALKEVTSYYIAPSREVDTLPEKNRIFIELGTHCSTGTQSLISKSKNNQVLYSEIRSPIDTNSIYNSTLIINTRIFPTIGFGIYTSEHEFKIEGSYSFSKSAYGYSEDYGKSAHFNSKEFYFLVGYCYTNLFYNHSKVKPWVRFFVGADLLYQYKKRNFYYGTFNNIGGGLGSSENLNADITSNHISLLPDCGIKFPCKQRFYFKLGVRFNAISFSNGNYSWNYETTSKGYPQIRQYSEQSDNYFRILYAGENKYFQFVDNIFLKIGVSF